MTGATTGSKPRLDNSIYVQGENKHKKFRGVFSLTRKERLLLIKNSGSVWKGPVCTEWDPEVTKLEGKGGVHQA